MMYRMNSGSTIWRPVPISASPNSVRDAEAVRPEPPQVLAQILAPLAAEQPGLLVLALPVLLLRALLDGLLAAGFVRTVVELPVAVVANEVAIALAG